MIPSLGVLKFDVGIPVLMHFLRNNKIITTFYNILSVFILLRI